MAEAMTGFFPYLNSGVLQILFVTVSRRAVIRRQGLEELGQVQGLLLLGNVGEFFSLGQLVLDPGSAVFLRLPPLNSSSYSYNFLKLFI